MPVEECNDNSFTRKLANLSHAPSGTPTVWNEHAFRSRASARQWTEFGICPQVSSFETQHRFDCHSFTNLVRLLTSSSRPCRWIADSTAHFSR